MHDKQVKLANQFDERQHGYLTAISIPLSILFDISPYGACVAGWFS